MDSLDSCLLLTRLRTALRAWRFSVVVPNFRELIRVRAISLGLTIGQQQDSVAIQGR